jgi:prephenate dehydrogenase
MESVAIVGVGLIGGSFGLALRSQGFAGPILGVSSSGAIQAALDLGAISARSTLEEAVESADLLYLAQPVDRILSTLEQLAAPVASRVRRRPILVTDAGSTKLRIVQHASRFLPPNCFLGGHPMAGKERSGVEAAEAGLFANRTYVLTPEAGFSHPFEPAFRNWLDTFGARVISLDAAEHDRVVAFTSHLPQLLSTALAATLESASDPLFSQLHGTGLLDMSRLALSSPSLWSSIIATNRDCILRAIDAFSTELEAIREAVERDSISTSFVRANTLSAALRK